MSVQTKLELNPKLDSPLPAGYSLKKEGRRYYVVTSQDVPLKMTLSKTKRAAVRNYHQLFGGVPVYVD